MRFDRDDLLAGTNLGALADEILGGRRGNGRGARWPSPVPGHPQTGASPPMSIFRDARGTERWTCFATGTSGTAIDLVMVATGRSVGEAIAWLADRGHATPVANHTPTRPPPRQPLREPSAAMRDYVDACATALWEPSGIAIRRWLVEQRALDPDVLRHNRIGADPGRRSLPRARGLPWRGPAAVFPALDEHRNPRYLQARYLHMPPGRPKYDNPTSDHGANPRVAIVEPTQSRRGAVLVTEGFPDALTAAGAGWRAVAALGAGLPNAAVADQVAGLRTPVVIAFDADAAGREGSAALARLLRQRDVDAYELCPPHPDLNTWSTEAGDAFASQLARCIDLTATARSTHARVR